MATTVNNAFAEFMKDVVNLDSDVVSKARSSRDNLLENIAEFDNDDDFFDLYQGFNVHFGSFARKTKCRELDDIDLMIGISANGATYNSSDPWDDVHMSANLDITVQADCANDNGTLNSTKVINKFKKKLENVREYSRSDIHKSGEAVVLNLTSKDWSFDIVPCFHTVKESDGRDYYLIPNGKGNWKKTDPLKDKEHLTNTNKEKDGRVLELIRLCKKWNKVKNAKTLPSYLLETMIINFADSKTELSEWIDLRFRDALKYIADNITKPIYDLKGIQGDINEIDFYDKFTLQQKANADYLKACEARQYESNNNQKEAVKKWGEIFWGGIFQLMDKNIYELQNKEIILKALVVQSKLYSKAKRINYFSLILCVLLPIGYSLTKNLLSGEVLLTIGALFTIALVFISPALSAYASKQKTIAAKIQQTIDFFLFEDETFKSRNDDWGEVYTKDELLEIIAKSKISEKDIAKKKNWYSDYSSFPHVMQAYYSQCECVRWDGDLSKCFVNSLYGCGLVLIVLVIIVAVALKMTVFELIINITTFAPLIKFLLLLKKQLVEDCNRLTNILHKQNTINNQMGVIIGGEELYPKVIEIQRELFEHRATALMVPDFFYGLKRKKQQVIEDEISSQKNNEGEL